MSAATSSRSPATWSRKRCGSNATAAATRFAPRAEEAAMDKLLDALTGKGSSEATRQSFRQRFTDGSLDQAEVEIEVDEQPAMPFEIPGMGAQVFDLKSMMGKLAGQAPAQAPQAQGARGIPAADRRGSRQAARSRRHQPRRAGRRRSQWHRLPRRDRQDRGQRRARRFGQPRGRPARPVAADRRHDGRDQIRAAQDRPHPVHRLGRVPHRQARRPAARASGPPADPCRTEGADPGGLRADPVGDPRQPHRAISGPARHRGRDGRHSPTTASRRSPASLPRSTKRSRISAHAGSRR